MRVRKGSRKRGKKGGREKGKRRGKKMRGESEEWRKRGRK